MGDLGSLLLSGVSPRVFPSLPELSLGALAESMSLPRTEPVEEW